MMKELQAGQVVRGKRVNFRRGRIAAILVLGLGVALGLSRTGTTVVTTGETLKPACSTGGGHQGSHGGGGGTILIGG